MFLKNTEKCRNNMMQISVSD